MSYFSETELKEMGVRAGRGVAVSRDARLFGSDRITFGDNVRIDAFCVISAGTNGHVTFGSHIHIASGTRIFGEGGVVAGDFSSVSSASTLYSASDDYSGEWLMGPHIPTEFTSVDTRPIELGTLAAIGAQSLLLPGTTLGSGTVLGAMSLGRGNLEPWTIYAGVPCRRIRDRQRQAEALAKQARRQMELS